MTSTVLATAEKAIAAGLSIIPIRADGSKAPKISSWKEYQDRRASLTEAHGWFDGMHAGLAVIGGSVSNGAEVLDFDRTGLWEEFQLRAAATGIGDLVRRIAVGYSERSPNGFHLIYRVAEPRTLKLAKLDATTTLIETRGEGGYCIVAPSNGRVHASGKPYELISGDFATLVALTADEHETLLSLARSFDECEPGAPQEPPPRVQADSPSDQTRPGDDFNAKASWTQVLEPAAWTLVYSQVGTGYWRRPGKSRGISASTEKYPGMLLVFSTSTEFESTLERTKGYTKFAAYAVLNHGSDFSAAARDLAAQGYGERSTPPQNPTRAPKRPAILINNRQAREVIADMVSAVGIANDPPEIFRRVGQVVRIVRSDLGVGEARKVAQADFLNVVSGSADFTRLDTRSKSEAPTHPNRELTSATFELLKHGTVLPILRAVTPTPIIHEDGVMVTTEGYDPATGIYFAPARELKLSPVPNRPSRETAQQAVATLMAPFRDMPFATNTDCANYLAALLTAVTRGWFPTVPFFVIEAPIQGSGKTLAAQATRVIVEGTAGIGAAPEADRKSDAEWRKRITSVLLSAPSIVIFDNVTGTLGGAALSALSTSPTFSDRLLGKNEAPDLPNTALWIFTSNNAQVDTDLLRRCVFVRLDPRDPTPYLRDGFSIPDLIGHLHERRGELLVALYTLVRFWIAQGKPGARKGTPVLGSFEKWSRIVPAILGAAGITGVLGDLEDRLSIMRDPDEEEAAAFLESWWEGFPKLRETATARDLVDAALASDVPYRTELPLPTAVIHGRSGDRTHAAIARSLGRWLKFRRDRMVTGLNGSIYVIRTAGGSEKRGFRWAIKKNDIGDAA